MKISNVFSSGILAIVVLSAPLFGTQREFSPTTSFTVDSEPNGIVASDFNGDGIPDIAALCANTETISVLLGDGVGGYARAQSVHLEGSGDTALAAGDLNGDGLADLAVATFSGSTGSLVIFLAEGAGTFGSATAYSLTTPAQGVTVTDVNRDGSNDVVVTMGSSSGHGSVAVFLNEGGGTLLTAKLYGAGEAVRQVKTADLNGDGYPDLLLSRNANSFGVLVNLGGGSFSPVQEFALSRPIGSFALQDLNRDGKVDLAASLIAPGSAVIVSLGKGDGTFEQPQTVVTGSFAGLDVADFNQDGLPDIAVNDGVTQLFVLQGNGDGTFVAPAAYNVRQGVTPWSTVAIDANLDGYPDVALTSKNVSISLNAGLTIPATVSPAAYTFSLQSVGTTSAPESVKLTNTSSTTLSISSVSISGDFIFKNKCGKILEPSASCNINVQFRPRGGGIRKGVLTITDSAANSPQKVQVTGMGQ